MAPRWRPHRSSARRSGWHWSAWGGVRGWATASSSSRPRASHSSSTSWSTQTNWWSARALLEVLWGFDDAVGTRAVDSRVAELRRVLGEDAADPRWIATVQGRGYRFVAAVTGADSLR